MGLGYGCSVTKLLSMQIRISKSDLQYLYKNTYNASGGETEAGRFMKLTGRPALHQSSDSTGDFFSKAIEDSLLNNNAQV